MTSSLARLLVVAQLSVQGALRGWRAVGLVGIASGPTLVLVALLAAHIPSSQLLGAAEALFLTLTLPVVAVVVLLVLFVAQFRTEIDEDTLAYLWSRSIPRWSILLGKFLGAFAAGTVILVPSALLPIGVAVAGGAPAPALEVVAVLVEITLIACAAYGSLFLLLGLLSPSALLLGLIVGFLWEQLLLVLPGSVPHLTILFYLRSLASDEVSTGPLSGFPNGVAAGWTVAAPILATVVFLVLAGEFMRRVEITPRRASA